MGLLNLRFPEGISYGSGGGPGFDTRIIDHDSGQRVKIRRRSTSRRRYNVAESVKDIADLVEIQNFYLAVGGVANSFRFKDFFDFTTAPNGLDAPTFSDHIIGVGDGVEVDFQLRKIYSAGSFTHTRSLILPVAGTVLASIDLTPTTDFTVNDTTGIITFDDPPAVNDVIRAGCEFDVAVSFDQDVDELLALSMDAFEEGSIPDIPLIEDINPSPISDQFFFGGSKNHGTLTADILISTLQGRLHIVVPDDPDLLVRLPLTTMLPLGGPYFAVKNTGTETITVAAFDATPVIAVPVGFMTEIWLGTDSGGGKVWVAK